MAAVMFISLSAAGAAFFAWFFVALCREGKRGLICHVLKIVPDETAHGKHLAEVVTKPSSLLRRRAKAA